MNPENLENAADVFYLSFYIFLTLLLIVGLIEMILFFLKQVTNKD